MASLTSMSMTLPGSLVCSGNARTRARTCRVIQIQCKESRVGKKPVAVPSNVKVELTERSRSSLSQSQSQLTAEGPLGRLSLTYPDEVLVELQQDQQRIIRVSRAVPTKRAMAMHGLFRSLTNNILTGVSKGFEKKLSLVGVGYRATMEGNDLVMFLGFSHPVRIQVPDNLKVRVEENTRVVVSGIEKSEVGRFAASIRRWRPPEPYKGKGIRYMDEVIRLKEGKAGKKK